MMSEVTLYMFKMCFTTAPPGRALMTSCLRGKERERERESLRVCARYIESLCVCLKTSGSVCARVHVQQTACGQRPRKVAVVATTTGPLLPCTCKLAHLAVQARASCPPCETCSFYSCTGVPTHTETPNPLGPPRNLGIRLR